MGNTLITPTIIAKESLMLLSNNAVMANLVHRDYSDEFVSGVGTKIKVKKPATFEAKEFDRNNGIQIQDAVESEVEVVMDKLLDVSFEVTSEQLSFSIQKFSEQLIAPAMESFAQKVDQYLTSLYVDIPYYYGTAGTTPSKIEDITGVRQKLNDNMVPFLNRRCVIDSSADNKLSQLSTFHEAEKVGDNGTALREGSLGRKFGLDFHIDQNIRKHTKGTLAADAPGITIKGAVAAGATTAVFDGANIAGTLKKGDIFTVADTSGSYVVTEDAAVAAGEITVKFYPAAPVGGFANDKVVTIIGSHTANLAFHKNAFALVTRPLALPMGLSSEQKAIVNYNGFGLRVIYDYNSQYKKDVISIDMICGVKTLTRELAARLLG